jgi:hypothetical protein
LYGWVSGSVACGYSGLLWEAKQFYIMCLHVCEMLEAEALFRDGGARSTGVVSHSLVSDFVAWCAVFERYLRRLLIAVSVLIKDY